MTPAHSLSRRTQGTRNCRWWRGAVACTALIAACLSPRLFSHETLTTTVLFDREIVRILDSHCVMCHVENGPSFPLTTYEQTWVRGRKIRADVIARHMPPWAAVPGYGEFANDNSLTLRETQFIVSWVEGLGPRNAGRVFTNVADQSAVRPKEVRAHIDFGYWQLGEPQLKRQLAANTIAAGAANQVRRTIVDLGLTSARAVRAVEFMPGDRRVVRAAFFRVQETGQWIGSWTPWSGYSQLPAGAAYRIPAGAHVVAEIHYRGTTEDVSDRGTLGLFFADQPRYRVSDVTLEAKGGASAAAPRRRLRAETRLTSDTYAFALRPELGGDVASVEVSARTPDGGTKVLLFAKDFSPDWPTPYVFKEPVLLRRGTILSVTAYARDPSDSRDAPTVRLTVGRY
jgi:hypothetical protein